jgi:hypothetical protein
MPEDVYEEIREKAWKARKSINQYILDCLEIETKLMGVIKDANADQKKVMEKAKCEKCLFPLKAIEHTCK